MKQRLSLVGLAFIITSLTACNLTNDKTLPKLFLIPSGIEGTLRIVFDEKCGIKPKEENGRQTLAFNNNGFLILSSDFPNGENNEYYLVDSNGKKTKVHVIKNFKERNSLAPAIVIGDVGVTYLASISNPKTLSTEGIAFQDFYLYNKGITEINEDRFSAKNDSLTNIAINDCSTNY